MVMLPNTFNTADVPPDEFDPVPAGTYQAIITESEMKATNSGDGAYLQLKVELSNGRILFERLNLQNKNETAVRIAMQTLGKICDAQGKTSVKDSNELHNKRMLVVVDIEKGKDYTDQQTGEIKQGRDQNVIKKWLPYNATQTNKEAGGGDSSSPAPASQGSTPPWRK